MLGPGASPRQEHDPAISVLVASCGPSSALDRCLSALASEVRGVGAELILVLNCARSSLDEGVVASYSARVDRLLFEPRIGKSHALNRGVLECRGDVIAFTDDDAEPQPGWLTAITEGLLAPDRPADLVGCGGRVLPVHPSRGVPAWYAAMTNGRRSHFLGPRHDLGDAIQDYEVPALKLDPVPFGVNFALRREIFERHRFDPDLGPNRSSGLLGGEDSLLALELLGERKRLSYRPDAIVHHPVHPTRISADFVLRAFFFTGVQTVRVMRALARPLPGRWRLRRALIWLRLRLLTVGISSDVRLMRLAVRHEFSCGMLAEMDGSFRRGAREPLRSAVALRAVKRLRGRSS